MDHAEETEELSAPPWFFTNATLDLGLGTVTPGAGNVTVTVRDVGQVPALPDLAITCA
ncbi:hypothetical protein [Longimicrobium sp.]|uniref:hypothetical protein n=1 Tax=Longimicrobium sp. TaxID=2029185 RepID=UPI002B61A982|nr:hypothetical protein [Longimicrobium sp.]HSU14231.1 hypothetical protein [Longimicrobium sp.]